VFPGGANLLEVVGNSLVKAAIRDGDFVVIRMKKSIEIGEIVAAKIDFKIMVKTFSRREVNT
jgi:repressor LexA